MVINHLKTVGSHFLIWAMLESCSKHVRMKELPFGIVQDAKKMFLKNITVGFEPDHFTICITSIRI